MAEVIAQVIVNHNSKAVDKLYDYLVPQEMEKMLGVGFRVIVPFGRGNQKKEAFVFKLIENSKTGRLKTIESVVDKERVFDDKMLGLIYYMRERYLCSYIDALRVIVPTGISAAPEEWVKLENPYAKPRTQIGKKIIEILKDNGGACEINYFMQFFESNVRSHILRMCENGVLKIEYREHIKVKDRQIRAASLDIDEADVKDTVELLYKNRAYSQAKILEILSGNDYIAVSDLVKFADCSYNTVSALEKKGYVRLFNLTVERVPETVMDVKRTEARTLNEEQAFAVGEISNLVNEEKKSTVLLYGVTGSGKTEVFMNVISEVIKKGKQAIMLVPEISLTPQTVNRFASRFGKRIAVLHSGLSLGERYDQWKRIRSGEADIVIGARSAVFAPCSNIGVIIMDEEHEQSYKSEMLPRYETHEVAEFRAAQNNAVLLLGSATPSIGSFYKALSGEYKLLRLTRRANSAQMPEVIITDMRKEIEEGNRSVFSRRLTEEIEKNLKNKEQTILFLNRRGFSTFVSCRSCGFTPKCPSCSISLTYHKYSDSLKCHYCGYIHPNYDICPVCGSKYIRYFGGGTQRVEDEVKKLFPEASVLRMDIDTTGKKLAHEKILNEFEKNKTDILIGTQMVAKGLDFENVTLVGVISADVMLNLGDYRASERSYSILEQVTGRAGRAKKSGRAIIQTYSPENSSVTCAKEHDYTEFYKSEIAMRRALYYPPFCEIVLVMFSSVNEQLTAQAARFFKKYTDGAGEVQGQILGPIPSAISKIKNKYRWQLVIKCENSDSLNVVLEDAVNATQKKYERVSVVIDKNPNGIV